MKTLNHLIHCSLLAGLASLNCLPVPAQLVFSVTNLPTQIGVQLRAYVGTDVDVSASLGQPGGPNRWDFSQPAVPGEAVERMDVVDPNDGGHGPDFPVATYAERITTEPSGTPAWSYYEIVPNQGRIYYGFHDAGANPACPLKVFDSPMIDLPDPVQFGHSWTRAFDFTDCADLGFIILDLIVHFSSQAEVDAYGSLLLPSIGEVQALRVNEVNTYEFVDLTLGLPIPTQRFRNYYWLIPGIGKGVEMISAPATDVPPPNLSTAKRLARVFEVRPWPVAQLRIRLQEGEVILDWRSETTSSGYRVEGRRDLSPSTPWLLLSEPTANSWAEELLPDQPHRFFRVWVMP